MTAKQLKDKLSKKTPLLMSPFGFALAACGGGGGSSSSIAQKEISLSSNNKRIAAIEVEGNDTITAANVATKGLFSGQLSSVSDNDYYYFGSQSETNAVMFTPSSGAATKSPQISLFDMTGSLLASKQMFDNGFIHAKTDGSFFIQVHSSDLTGTYNISVYESFATYEEEPNNSLSSATRLYNNQPVNGQISTNKDVDYFTFTASQNIASINLRKLTFVDVNGEGAVAGGGWPYGDHRLSVYDQDGGLVAQYETLHAFPTGETFQVATVPNQDYYVTVDDNDAVSANNGAFMVLDKDYSLSVFGAIASNIEPRITGIISNDEDIDVIDLTGKGDTVVFTSNNANKNHLISFRDAVGQDVYSQDVLDTTTFNLKSLSADNTLNAKYMFISSTEDFSEYLVTFTDI